jgi:putative phosphotransacetylase
MTDTEQLAAAITEAVLKRVQQIPGWAKKKLSIPAGISNRHVHLSETERRVLFGAVQLTKWKDLSQPGQFACEQKVTLVTARGAIENVRVLGPVRPKTQVELAPSDCVKLGLAASVRDSGDLAGSAGITIIGPHGTVILSEGVIIAARHIHMHTDDAVRFGCKDGDIVSVTVPGRRGLVFQEVLVRVGSQYRLEFHVDIDEANAACLKNGEFVEIGHFF